MNEVFYQNKNAFIALKGILTKLMGGKYAGSIRPFCWFRDEFVIKLINLQTTIQLHYLGVIER